MIVAWIAGALLALLPLPPLPPLPPPPPLCPPICLLPPEPPPGVPDAAPTLELLEPRRDGDRIVLRWRARDDFALAGFRVYVDGWKVRILEPRLRSVSLRFRCGRHSYRVEAIDSSLQRTSRSVSIRRRC